jgi:hypothetical protein
MRSSKWAFPKGFSSTKATRSYQVNLNWLPLLLVAGMLQYQAKARIYMIRYEPVQGS